MKTNIQKFENEEEWLAFRLGRFTGTRASDALPKRGGGYKKGFYELIAERVAIPRDNEDRMDRGKRLESEALDRFEEETGKKLNKELVFISREDEPNIGYSPDGLVVPKKGKAIEEDCEVKCLNSASHIEAWLTKKVPSEYEEQVLQGFVTNDSLKKRHLIFYDPSMPKDFFFFTIERKDVQADVDNLLSLERQMLEEIARIEKELTF